MSETVGSEQTTTTSAVPRQRAHVQAGSWMGWITFAGVMMIMMGIFHVIAGLTALFRNDYFLVQSSNLLVVTDYSAWGWTHLIFGLVVFLAGFGVMTGQTWARVVGIVLAVLSAIVSMGFLAAYPLWSAIIIAVDITVIYALAVHGREARQLYAHP